MGERPAVPYQLEPGYEWFVADDDAWSMRFSEGFRCLFRGVDGRCPNNAAATLMRQTRSGKRPYRYCEQHMYGRWIEDGRVVGWRVRKGAVRYTA